MHNRVVVDAQHEPPPTRCPEERPQLLLESRVAVPGRRRGAAVRSGLCLQRHKPRAEGDSSDTSDGAADSDSAATAAAASSALRTVVEDDHMCTGVLRPPHPSIKERGQPLLECRV